MVKESIFGVMVHITLANFYKDSNMAMENGNRQHKIMNYTSDSILGIKNKERENIYGIIDVFMTVSFTAI